MDGPKIVARTDPRTVMARKRAAILAAVDGIAPRWFNEAFAEWVTGPEGRRRNALEARTRRRSFRVVNGGRVAK